MTLPKQLPIWQRLLIKTPEPDRAVAALQDWAQAAGYTVYDPFAGGVGAPFKLKDRLKLFIGPARTGWTPLFVAPDTPLPDAACQAAARTAPSLEVRLYADQPPQVTLYNGEDRPALPAALQPFLREDISPQALTQAWDALHQTTPAAEANTQSEEMSGPMRWLVKRVAGRYLDQVRDELGDEFDAVKAQAQDAIRQQSGDDIWERADHQAVQAVLALLSVPSDWHLPGWDVLNRAYRVARQQQSPRPMPSLPGDDEALQAVPNALDYQPLFYARAPQPDTEGPDPS